MSAEEHPLGDSFSVKASLPHHHHELIHNNHSNVDSTQILQTQVPARFSPSLPNDQNNNYPNNAITSLQTFSLRHYPLKSQHTLPTDEKSNDHASTPDILDKETTNTLKTPTTSPFSSSSPQTLDSLSLLTPVSSPALTPTTVPPTPYDESDDDINTNLIRNPLLNGMDPSVQLDYISDLEQHNAQLREECEALRARNDYLSRILTQEVLWGAEVGEMINNMEEQWNANQAMIDRWEDQHTVLDILHTTTLQTPFGPIKIDQNAPEITNNDKTLAVPSDTPEDCTIPHQLPSLDVLLTKLSSINADHPNIQSIADHYAMQSYQQALYQVYQDRIAKATATSSDPNVLENTKISHISHTHNFSHEHNQFDIVFKNHMAMYGDPTIVPSHDSDRPGTPQRPLAYPEGPHHFPITNHSSLLSPSPLNYSYTAESRGTPFHIDPHYSDHNDYNSNVNTNRVEPIHFTTPLKRGSSATPPGPRSSDFHETASTQSYHHAHSLHHTPRVSRTFPTPHHPSLPFSTSTSISPASHHHQPSQSRVFIDPTTGQAFHLYPVDSNFHLPAPSIASPSISHSSSASYSRSTAPDLTKKRPKPFNLELPTQTPRARNSLTNHVVQPTPQSTLTPPPLRRSPSSHSHRTTTHAGRLSMTARFDLSVQQQHQRGVSNVDQPQHDSSTFISNSRNNNTQVNSSTPPLCPTYATPLKPSRYSLQTPTTKSSRTTTTSQTTLCAQTPSSATPSRRTSFVPQPRNLTNHTPQPCSSLPVHGVVATKPLFSPTTLKQPTLARSPSTPAPQNKPRMSIYDRSDLYGELEREKTFKELEAQRAAQQQPYPTPSKSVRRSSVLPTRTPSVLSHLNTTTQNTNNSSYTPTSLPTGPLSHRGPSSRVPSTAQKPLVSSRTSLNPPITSPNPSPSRHTRRPSLPQPVTLNTTSKLPQTKLPQTIAKSTLRSPTVLPSHHSREDDHFSLDLDDDDDSGDEVFFGLNNQHSLGILPDSSSPRLLSTTSSHSRGFPVDNINLPHSTSLCGSNVNASNIPLCDFTEHDVAPPAPPSIAPTQPLSFHSGMFSQLAPTNTDSYIMSSITNTAMIPSRTTATHQQLKSKLKLNESIQKHDEDWRNINKTGANPKNRRTTLQTSSMKDNNMNGVSHFEAKSNSTKFVAFTLMEDDDDEDKLW